MRIIAGTMRGLKLAGVGAGDDAAHLRPTGDRVREALFNVLTQGRHGNLVAGARVLDLFAGTGALGIEALSRGADTVCFVENGAKALALLSRNIKLARSDAARIVKQDATRLTAAPGAPFDLVFMDPPYGKAFGQQALAAAMSGGWLAPGAVVVWEENAPQHAPRGFTRLDSRRYGDTHITILEREPDAQT